MAAGSENSKEERCREAGGQMVDGHCIMPEVTFPTFIMSLNTTVLYHLGELADPVTGDKVKDLILAKHTIDTLEMLKKKTDGNLEADEKKMLNDILYDLKIRYVRICG
ncbi:MAG: DUF1844 domain-containing protein [Thermodesulfobacteriota bacterium]